MLFFHENIIDSKISTGKIAGSRENSSNRKKPKPNNKGDTEKPWYLYLEFIDIYVFSILNNLIYNNLLILFSVLQKKHN